MKKMNRKTAMIVLSVLIVILPAYAQVPAMPHGISGIVYMSDGVTEASWGTSFSVNDTTSGDYIEGTTGAGPHSGWDSTLINGTDGDEVIVKAWNTTHYGITTVTLLGTMTEIDVVINKISALPPTLTLTPTQAYPKGGGGADAEPQNVTPTTATPAEATPILTPAQTSSITPMSTPAPTPKPGWKIPGFEALFAILGLLTVAYLLKSCKGGGKHEED